MAGYKALVTGGSGFIGTNLVEELLRRQIEILSLDIEPPRNAQHTHLWRRGDIMDKGAVLEIFREYQPDVVFHLAARTDLKGRDPVDYSENVAGVRNVMAACDGVNVRHVVLASSMLVCRLGYIPRHDEDYCPDTAYGASKAEGERIVRQWASPLSWTIVRPTSLWGPWFREPYRDFFEAVRRGRYVNASGASTIRSYGFVLNATDSLIRIGELSRSQPNTVLKKTFYLADPEPIEIQRWASQIATAFRVRGPRSVPYFVLFVFALLGDLALRLGIDAVPLTSRRLRNMFTSAQYDVRPLYQAVGPARFTCAEAVEMTVEWMHRQEVEAKA
jgi:nucleoside-diphosphate-sugar epimerase